MSEVFNWRAYLPIHPAAELFPLMKEVDPKGFNALVENIRVRGLVEPIAGWVSNEGVSVLDGRNRLDALAQLGLLYEMSDHHVGIKKWTGEQWSNRGTRIAGHDGAFRNFYGHNGNPFEIVLSLNAHRRHLTAAQKDDRIAAVLKAKSELSNRQIGEITKTDKKKVGAVRAKMEATGVISPVEKRTGKDNKAHPAKAKKKSTSTAVPPVLIEAMIKAKTKAKVETKVSAEQTGEFLEQLGAERFFAALQFAPKPRAEIERRVIGARTTKKTPPPEPESKIDYAKDILGIESNKVPDDLSIPGFLDRRPPPEPVS
jgi:hypothetical protein